ncbi:probable RNA-binding protein 19 [Drosophila guanche]|uniref:Blast:Probable RNA-binding protein 19 n=2 Tax=Drosophila guanche TaxID=7266 RepID=A0A3B0K241_DROGU|nr:probable RNA-binding protein 19 [Drosophila guanche]SPP86732.1 blast:Probable RNA-binding protein 19 [Drosophila guanche]
MSRIIVKQLPKHITEDKLRNIFGAKGTITDLQLKYTPDGKFRQFCFVGYSTEEEAQDAIQHFNNSCIQTSRVRVESCAALGSESKPQSWSKHAKDSKHNLDKLKAAEEEKEKKASPGSESKKKEKAKKDTKVVEILGKHKDDPEFQEFLQAHDKTRTLWGNDLGVSEQNPEKEDEDEDEAEPTAAPNDGGVDADGDEPAGDEEESPVDEEAEKLAEKPISDLEYMKSLMAGKAAESTAAAASSKKSKVEKSSLDLFTIKIHNVPYNTKRQEVLKFFKPLKPYSVRLPGKVHGFCYVGFKTEKDMAKAMVKNKSFIKGKQVFFSDFTEKNKVTKASKSGLPPPNAPSESGANSKWKHQHDGLSKEENISESGRIFFRNLAYTTTEEELQKLFEEYGPVVEVNLPVDKLTRKIKGFGTVTYMMPEHALKAFNALDGTDFHGRLLHLLPGKELDNKDQNELDEDDSSLTFKQKKALKLKKSAQKPIGWNTLFLGPNAVADILAKQFKTSKERILDTSEGGSSAAVRLALGETQIVIEMKKFLEDEGVRLSAFDEPSQKRSKTVILAKNLPAATELSELSPIFSRFGPIGRLVLPPSGVTALIEFCEPSEARQAFKKLAYSKFKNAPLYLEWAPEQTFATTLSGEPIIPKTEKEEPKEKEPKRAPTPEVKEESKPEPVDDEEPEPDTTIFLRNLNFKTVKETVLEHFRHLGAIHSVEIAKRKDPQNPQQFSSLGYGFIQFKKASVADHALKNLQLTHIDGNPVELKRSDRVLKNQNEDASRRGQSAQKKQTGTKILVRNIPFQAQYREVREVFKAFGELRSLRIPKKVTAGEDAHRGFGFVDFITKADAKRAFDALSASTHLYGRRLVLEWASHDDQNDLDELRKRTAARFDDTQAGTAAKQSRRAFFDVEGNIQAPEENEEEEENLGRGHVRDR